MDLVMILVRTEILRPFAEAMKATDAVLALWEDGAASFGRVDAYSDIDLNAIVKPGLVDDVANSMRLALSRISVIQNEYRQVTYHGDTQYFWQLKDASPFTFMDISLIEQRSAPYRIDRSIHGDPIIHFDTCQCLAVVEESPAERSTRIRERLKQISAVAELQPWIVKKYLLRNEPLHAFGTYQRWMIQPLIELLRLKHCPQRSSFHTTYLLWDLPPDVTERLAPLMMAADIGDIDRNLSAVRKWIQELLDLLSPVRGLE